MSNEALVSLWETKQCSDVTIVFQDSSNIKAHRCILAANSKYFHVLLSETNNDEIPDNSNPEIMFSLLKFWYTGEIQPNLTNSKLLQLALLALKFEATETVLNEIVNAIILRSERPLNANDFVNFGNFSTKFKTNLKSVSNLHIQLAREFLDMGAFDIRLDFSTVVSWLRILLLGSSPDIINRFGNYCCEKNVALDKCKPLFLYLLSFIDNPFVMKLQKFGVSDFEILEQHLLRKSMGLTVSQKKQVSSTEWRMTMKPPQLLISNDVNLPFNSKGYCALVEPCVIYEFQTSGHYHNGMFGVISTSQESQESWVNGTYNCLLDPEENCFMWGAKRKKASVEYNPKKIPIQMRIILEDDGLRSIQFRNSGEQKWETAKQDNDMCQLLVVVGLQMFETSFDVGDKITVKFQRRTKEYPATIKEINADDTYHILFDDGDENEKCMSSLIPWCRLLPVTVTLRTVRENKHE